MEQQNKLPVGVTSFRDMIKGNYIYVDKTDLVAKLAQDGAPCFLARPRRFGKSTLVNTFQELFTNGLENFKGLKAEKEGVYTDTTTYTVLHLNFSSCSEDDDIRAFLVSKLTEEFRRNAIDYDEQLDDPRFLLSRVVNQLDHKSLVLLIDEYDAPLTKTINKKKLFAKRRSILSSFYAVIKELSDSFRFIFITGISRYSHMSIFSEFNNLQDLSLCVEYGALLGYTQDELEFYFKDYIEAAACALNHQNNTEEYSYPSVLQLLKQNYDGYCFEASASTLVYNPWSILKFLRNPSDGFINYWIRSGAAKPSLLVKYLKQQVRSGFVYEGFLDLDQTITIDVDELVANIVDMHSEEFSFEAVLYQTGYFSIKSCYGSDVMLGIPNLEVKKAYAKIILKLLGKKIKENEPFSFDFKSTLRDAFNLKQFETVKDLMNQLVNSLSYESVSKFNESIFRDLFKITMLFASATNIQTESPNALGRSDLLFTFGDTCFVCEFKLATKLTEVNTKLAEAEVQMVTHDYANILGFKKIVPLAIVVVNQPKSSTSSAVRRIEVIKEVNLNQY